MIEKEVVKKVYISQDGMEFLDAKECEKYEKCLKEKLSKEIKFFCVFCEPDYDYKNGEYNHKIFIAVLSRMGYHRDIAFEWVLRKVKGYLDIGNIGIHKSIKCQPKFIISECSKEDYDKASPNTWGEKSEKVFLSPERVEGYLKNFNYIKEWGFK